MRLFLAEKPSLARAIADVLLGPLQRRDGYFQCGGDLVAWCAGHILELAAPDAYDRRYKEWRLDHLPIAPEEWKLVASAPDLLKTIEALLPRASRVVHAGDPDREGQLLVDEVLEFLGYRGPVDRLLISDLNPPAVRAALDAMRPNTEFRGLGQAALARQRADWIYGINLTRLYTLLGRAGGYGGVLSVGRVQTPLLGLVVRRDLEIEGFTPKPYYVVRAFVRGDHGTFTATWRPPDDAPFVDEAGRVVDRAAAQDAEKKAGGKPGKVVASSREKKSEAPPLPYALPNLQIDAGKRLNLGPKEVLDACQSLYETHRLLTYPRSDCPYLPVGHLEQAGSVLGAIAANAPALAPMIGAHRGRPSRAWNDAKVTAHHAIVPTSVAKSAASLTPAERGVYELVARRYIAQFYPSSEFYETTVEIVIAGERFCASGRQPLADGWRALFAPTPPDEDHRSGTDDDEVASVPLVQEGQEVVCTQARVDEKRTSPPKSFTEGELIQAMTGIARHVRDPRIKQLLRETDGIGTPATQARIIQTLFDRKFIEKCGRQVTSTPIGRALVQILPATATTPDMTALWEAATRRIADGQMPLPAFLDAVSKQLGEIVETGRSLGALRMPAAHAAPASVPERPRSQRLRRSARRRHNTTNH